MIRHFLMCLVVSGFCISTGALLGCAGQGVPAEKIEQADPILWQNVYREDFEGFQVGADPSSRILSPSPESPFTIVNAPKNVNQTFGARSLQAEKRRSGDEGLFTAYLAIKADSSEVVYGPVGATSFSFSVLDSVEMRNSDYSLGVSSPFFGEYYLQIGQNRIRRYLLGVVDLDVPWTPPKNRSYLIEMRKTPRENSLEYYDYIVIVDGVEIGRTAGGDNNSIFHELLCFFKSETDFEEPLFLDNFQLRYAPPTNDPVN